MRTAPTTGEGMVPPMSVLAATGEHSPPARKASQNAATTRNRVSGGSWSRLLATSQMMPTPTKAAPRVSRSEERSKRRVGWYDARMAVAARSSTRPAERQCGSSAASQSSWAGVAGRVRAESGGAGAAVMLRMIDL